MIPDAHCHIDQLADPSRAIAEATEAGVGPILGVAMDAASAGAILELRERHPGSLVAGIGLHPSRIPELSPDRQDEELRLLEALVPDADFIGEIGLDFKDALTQADRARQAEALARQIEWAEAHRLPINLHSRRADRQVLEAAIAFRARTGLGALMHWFTHSEKLALLCGAEGIFISPGPSVMIDSRTAAVAATISSGHLLVETDAPVAYGALGIASPSWAARVTARLAELRGVPFEALASAMAERLRAYFEGSRPPTHRAGLASHR